MAVTCEKNATQSVQTDSEAHSCAGKQAQSQATWVVERLVGKKKGQSLFTATEGPEG